MSTRLSEDAMSRSRRTREGTSAADVSQTSGYPPTGNLQRSSFGVQAPKPSIINQSESNASLRSLMSGITLKKKLQRAAKRSGSVAKPEKAHAAVPLNFKDATEAVNYLEAQFSRKYPEWLRATGVISVELSIKTSEVSRLKRECEAFQEQLRDQTDAQSARRKLRACEDELQQALEQTQRALDASKALKGELNDVREASKARCSQLEDEVRRLRSENTTLRASLRQKDLSLDSAISRQRSLEKDIAVAMNNIKETEESCRDVVYKTKAVANEERARKGITEQELSKAKAQSRQQAKDHEYAMGRKERQVTDLKADLRQKTLRTAARALNRMQKYSTWRAFAKMKGMADQRKVVLLQDKVSSAESNNAKMIELVRAKQSAEMQLARLREEHGDILQREQNMLNVISWLLDLHSSSDGEDEALNQEFLRELRSVYETAKLRGPQSQ